MSSSPETAETTETTGPVEGMHVSFSDEDFVVLERVVRQVPGVGEFVFIGERRFVVQEVAWFLDEDTDACGGPGDPVADVRMAETKAVKTVTVTRTVTEVVEGGSQ